MENIEFPRMHCML